MTRTGSLRCNPGALLSVLSRFPRFAPWHEASRQYIMTALTSLPAQGTADALGVFAPKYEADRRASSFQRCIVLDEGLLVSLVLSQRCEV